MAATAWVLYNRAIRKLGAGVIVLPGAVRVALVKSASNFATSTLSLWGSVTQQVTSGFGYSTSGKTLTGEAWTTGTSGGQIKFDVTDPVWSAAGGNITSIKAAVLFMSGAAAGSCHVLGWAQLSTAAFNLNSGNSLTLVMNSAGVFTVANV